MSGQRPRNGSPMIVRDELLDQAGAAPQVSCWLPCRAAFKSGRCRWPFLLKTIPAKHRPPLRWAERQRCLFPTLRTNGPVFRPGNALGPGVRCRKHGHALGFARSATLGFVSEILVVEKHLLTGCKNEVRAALHALQHLVLEFH